MKTVILAGLLILSTTNPTMAVDQSEKTCKQQVQATMIAISTIEVKTGEEKNINGLTQKDIQKMLKTKSYCEVAKEIARKTMPQN